MTRSKFFTALFLLLFTISIVGCSITAETEESSESNKQTQQEEAAFTPPEPPPLPEEQQKALEFLNALYIKKNTKKAQAMWTESPDMFQDIAEYTMKPGPIMMASRIRDIDKWYIYFFIPYPQYSEGSLLRLMIEKRGQAYFVTDLDDRKKFFADYGEFQASSVFEDLGKELIWNNAELR